MKKAISLFLALMLIISTVSVSFSAFAAEAEPRYFQRGILNDGENPSYWIIDKDNKILYLSGNGTRTAKTPDYPNATSGPFAGRKDVTRIVIEEDVAYVGAYVFANMTSVDTIEIQSNLLKSENSINSNAFSGDTGIRNVQGDSEVLSTNTLINAVKVGIGVFTGDWLSVVKNVINTGSDVISDDGTLDNATVDAMVDDFANNGERIFIGDVDAVVSNYEEKAASPCYFDNAFHHNFIDETVVTAATCTEDGIVRKNCSVCNKAIDEAIPALGHNYVDEVYVEATCTKRGVMDRHCTICGDSSFSVIPAKGHYPLRIPPLKATCTSTGLTEGSVCRDCGETLVQRQVVPMTPHDLNYTYDSSTDSYTAECDICESVFTEFDNDTEALVEAESLFNSIDAEDYTAESYNALKDAAELHKDLKKSDTLAYPQFVIDEEITDILTKYSELEPYLVVELEGENAEASYTYNEETISEGTNNVVFGTDVTFSAVPDSGYTFIAWYDVNTKRYLSTESEFTYKITSNLNIQAIVKPTSYITLTFHGEGGQVISSISHSPDEWAAIDEIDDLLPRVPYKYGYTNGRWNYDSRTLIELSLKRNQDIYALYDEVDVPVPELPSVTSDAPALSLTYYYSNQNHISVGTFIMASNIPDGCEVQTIGLAYIKKPAAEFDPTSVLLTLNSKVTTARFGAISDSGLYILNIRNLTKNSNWAVKGYMTYYDNNGKLKTAYTNQINLVNREEV